MKKLLASIFLLFEIIIHSPKITATGIGILVSMKTKAQLTTNFSAPVNFNVNANATFKYGIRISDSSLVARSDTFPFGMIGRDASGNLRWMRSDSILGVMSSKYYPLSSNPAGYLSSFSVDSSLYATRSYVQNNFALLSGVYSKSASDAKYYLSTNPSGYISSYTETDPLSLHISDTATALSRYLRSATAAGTYATISNLALKVNISDTSSMLSRYLLSSSASSTYATQTALGLKVNVSDTSSMLSTYLKSVTAASTYATIANLALKNNISDTSAMLANYAKSSAVALKLNLSDTASMLNKYLLITNYASSFNTQFATKTSDNLTEGSTNKYYTDTRSRTAISLTTTGTSGAATYNNSTGVLNIPQYTSSAGTVTSITATSPLTGGAITTSGSIGIQNGAADNATKGAVSHDSSYFAASGGNISFAVKFGTGTVAASAVTINAPRGKITLGASTNIALNTNLNVTLTNSYITSTSTITPNINGAGSALTVGLNCYIKSQTAGSCVINILNLSLLSLINVSGLVIDYMVIN